MGVDCGVNTLLITAIFLKWRFFSEHFGLCNAFPSSLSVINHESTMPDPLNLAFAELLKDPKASFPRAFTICSSAMASSMDTKTSSGYIVFFTLTGLDDLPYLTGLYDKDQNGSFGLVEVHLLCHFWKAHCTYSIAMDIPIEQRARIEQGNIFE